MTLLDDLLAYFPLNEERGDARSHNGAWRLLSNNHVSSAVGKVGTYARSFNGTDQYLSVDDSAFQMGDVDFTICAWVNFDSLPSYAAIAGRWNTGASPREYLLEYSSSRFVFWARNSADTTQVELRANTFGAPSTGTWYFVVAQYDATNDLLKIGVNNGTMDTAALAGGTNKSNAKFIIGTRNEIAYFWNGRIEGVGVWRRLLTTDEITALYNSGNGLAYPFGVSLFGNKTWRVWVDWNGDGVYEADEASRLIAIPRIERGKPSLHDDPMVGVCELQLSNYDRRFDAWYAGSALYPNLGINSRIKIEVEIAGVTYPRFAGRIVDVRAMGFRASGAQGGARKVTLTAHDGWRMLQSRKIEIALSQNTTQRDAIAALLNAVGWTQSANLWILGSGVLGTSTILGGVYGDNIDLGTENGDDIPYWWVFNDESPSSNLLDLVKAHLGRVHVTANGRLVWRTVAADNGMPNDLTLTDAVLQEMTMSYPLDSVRNKIVVKSTPRSVSALAAIWTLNEAVELMAGESREFWADYSNAAGEHVPAIGVTTPVSTTDYTANSIADGSGDNLTANISVSITAYGSNSKLIVTNSGTRPAFLTLLQLRGQVVDALEAQAQVEEDSISQEDYGLQELEFNLRWQQKTLIAQDMATYALSAFKDASGVIELKCQDYPALLAYDLGEKILDDTSFGNGDKYRIGNIIDEVPENEACQRMFTTWRLYPIPPDDAWILGTHVLDTSTVLGF